MQEASEYERIIWIHNCLKNNNLSFDEYSHKFAKSYRTFYRDINGKLVAYFNAPISKKDGGFFYTDKMFELPHMFIPQKELSALYTALGLTKKYKNTPIYSSTKKLVDKLSGRTNGADFIGFRVGDLKKKEIELDWEDFNKIATSITSKESIIIDYHSFNSNKRTIRQVDPYHLYAYDEELYLAGFCYQNRDVRDFNLNRIYSVKQTNIKFNSKFEKKKYFADKNWGIIKGIKIEKVRLKIKTSEVERILEDFPSRFKKISMNKDWVEYEIETSVTDEFLNWVLSFRDEVIVVEPKTLKDEIRNEVSKILRNYLK